MRGKGPCSGWRARHRRITPAYAGKSRSHSHSKWRWGDHPRVCGEKEAGSTRAGKGGGSPPRMRGKGVHQVRKQGFPGITPAYAGKSGLPAAGMTIDQDHPRVCGEKAASYRSFFAGPGSPPRMRGKGPQRGPRRGAPGITPAYAGKSLPVFIRCPRFLDHPRVCGEKRTLGTGGSGRSGSPPRMRGKGPKGARP